MKRVSIAVLVILFLVGFATAGMTSLAVDDESDKGNNNSFKVITDNLYEKNNSDTNSEDSEDRNSVEMRECEKWKCSDWGDCINEIKTRRCSKVTNCTSEEESPKISKECREKERLRNNQRITECPEECICTGVTVKCELASGREMTIFAGRSGNMIVQIKGVNVSTNVTLYKSNNAIYGVFKNNETKRIRILPDQIREKIRERIKKNLENENITLNEDGVYAYQAIKKAKLFFLIPVEVEVTGELDSETGRIIQVKNSWWSFLAKDDENEEVMGASCGTVTPGENDNCCKNKEYDYWNSTANECEFNSDE